jgi:hypothetical protein
MIDSQLTNTSLETRDMQKLYRTMQQDVMKNALTGYAQNRVIEVFNRIPEELQIAIAVTTLVAPYAWRWFQSHRGK